MNERLRQVRKLLAEKHLDAVFISSLPNITYLTNFSGFSNEDRDAYLLITKKKQYIFTHGIYQETVQYKIPEFTLIPIKRENPISNALKGIIIEEKLERVGFESFDLTVSEFDRLTITVPNKILTPASLIEQLRTSKNTDEIRAIKKACELGDKAFTVILKQLKIGMTEKELATELEFFIKQQGADISFPTIVAFNANASMPHHIPTDLKLKQNSLILLDFGVKLHNYCSDMTRTFFFGKATKKQKTIYQTVLTAQQNAIATLTSLLLHKSLIEANKIDKIARDYITSQGYPSIPHSIGHGIGLKVHESPRLTPISNEKLTNGMVFSIEPGIYLPGEFGVRIEDLFAIEKNTLINLTLSPNHFTEI